jgi:tetratricopeptide (TPR) repeat protein
MSPWLRLAVALALGSLLLPPTAGAADPGRPAAPDSARVESPPAPLLVPPARPAAPGPAPEDTAVVNARRRGLEEFGRGLMLEEQRAYAGAIVSYMNAARWDPTLKGPSLRVGLLYASRQQWDRAARAFREELRRDPESRVAAREFAVALAELGDTTRSVRMLADLTRRAPGDATVWRALGFAHTRAGHWDAAERALRGAVGLDRGYALAWRDLGVVLAARERHGEARDAYRRAIAADSSDATTLVNLANLEARLADHVRALALYRQAERRDTTLALAYRGQVRELVALEREAEAGEVWRRWLARTPADREVREGAARHFVRLRRADVALAIAREGVRLAPDAGEPWWLLGEIHRLAGDPGEALSAYREASTRFPQGSDRARAEASIAGLRAAAPDSLRARFAADSAAHAARDTVSRPER